MTHDLDAKTGLPVLPEGYFWRVRRGALEVSHLELRKRVGWFSKTIASRVCNYYYTGGVDVIEPEVEILFRAESIMKEFHDPWIPFYGDYPPNTISKEQE